MNVDGAQYVRDLFWLMPELWLALAGFGLLLWSPFAKSDDQKRAIAWSSVFAQALALVLLVVQARPELFAPAGPNAMGAVFKTFTGGPLMLVDGLALVLKGTLLLAGILCTLMGVRFLEIERIGRGEFHAILLFALVGAMFLVSATDFITLFVGLETMSLSVYLLVGWQRDSRRSNEAALKYFLLGAFASGILLYGMSLVYGATGSTNLFMIRGVLESHASPHGSLLSVGVLLLVVGVGFKMAAAPFHVWSPDAYEGAPTVVTAFMSTAVKTAAFGLGLRLFLVGLGERHVAAEWLLFFALMAALSMTLGNFVALLQDNIKRLLAYSSIAHAGYMLLGLVASGAVLAGRVPDAAAAEALRWGQLSVVLYAIAYTVTNIGAFALIVAMRRGAIGGDRVDDFAGLARRSPWMAAAMTVFLLSLGGLPATAGFIGKYWLFGSIIHAGYGWLAAVAALNTAVSMYYYLRIVVKMYMAGPEADAPYAVTPALTATVVITAVLVIAIGLFPARILGLIEGTAQLVR